MKLNQIKGTSVFDSVIFFRATLAVFILEAVWIALSGVYSMAYDENTHLGIIRFYSDRFVPFWSQQPAGADTLGAISRDPSYLYHYLMSFPYRIFAQFFHSETAQIIFLRSFSIAMFLGGILLFRKVLQRTGISKALLNVIFALFILTPVAPFLAAQMNYDNLLFLSAGACLLLTQKITEELSAKRRLNVKNSLLLIGIAALSSLVKYAFLPVLVGLTIYLTVVMVKFIKQQKFRKVRKDIAKQLQAFTKLQAIFYTLLIIVAGGLFIERYAVNTIRYHTPTPECDQVLNIGRCLSYGPWRRNYLTRQDKEKGLLEQTFPKNPINYTIKMWGKRITNELFFTVDGNSSNFKTRDPYRITRYLSVAVIIGGLLLFIRWQRELRQRFKLNLLITVAVIYVVLLWTQNYMDFLHLGYPFAIQGRYLIPVLPILYLIMGLGYARLLWSRPYLKPVLAWSAIAILVTQGGGAGIFILRSDESWYWPNHLVITMNNAARTFLGHFTIGN